MDKRPGQIILQVFLTVFLVSTAQADFGLMLGSFKNRDNALKYVTELNKGQAEKRYGAFLDAVQVPGRGGWYRVCLGPFETRKEALIRKKDLVSNGFTSDLILVRVRSQAPPAPSAPVPGPASKPDPVETGPVGNVPPPDNRDSDPAGMLRRSPVDTGSTEAGRSQVHENGARPVTTSAASQPDSRETDPTEVPRPAPADTGSRQAEVSRASGNDARPVKTVKLYQPDNGSEKGLSESVSPDRPLQMTIENAVLLAFENNWEFRVERWTPDIQRTFEDEERAVFDPTLSAEAGWTRERDKSDSINKGVEGSLGISEFFPTGTEVGLGAQLLQEDKTFLATPNDEYRTTVGLTVTQALMRGMGLDVNLASLRQARIDTRASEYELRGLAQSLLAEVENAYWDYTLAKEEVKIFENSLELANRLTRETAERIRLGQVAEYEIFSAEAEAATRFQELINARSRRDTARLRLLRLVNPPSKDVWDREIVLLSRPESRDPNLEGAHNHIQVALRMRPELNQARLAIQRGELEVVKTKNGLLPKLDLFVFLGRTGYADSFGRSIRDIGKSDGGLDFSAGLRFQFPIGNRAPRAEYKRSTLVLEQEQESLRNLMQLVEQDVLSAYIEIDRSRKQIGASRDTREFQKEKLDAEIWKYRLGKSTMFRVAQAERDLVDSQISAVRATIEHIKSLTQFYLVEGSLLVRRGISAPGREPMELASGN